MFEMPPTSKNDCHPVLICRGDNLLVPHRAARLDHRDYTGVTEKIDAVAEWEETVRRYHRTVSTISSLIEGTLGRADS
jgi:hypothetical protein